MKKILTTIALSFLITASMYVTSNAADLATVAGNKLTITDATANATFTFQTSPQVQLDGETSNEAFIVAAVHVGSLNKDNGTAYAMGSDVSGLYASPLKGVSAIPAVALPTGTTTMESALSTAKYVLEGTTSSSGT